MTRQTRIVVAGAVDALSIVGAPQNHGSAHTGMTMAKATKLTERAITKTRLRPQQKQVVLWDSAITGFGVRILAGGSKTFWFQYRPAAGRSVSSRMVRIGPWPSVSLNAARRIAKG